MLTVNGRTCVTVNGETLAPLPGWAWKLICRLSKLERGHAYTLTFFVTGDEPVWTIQNAGKLENQ